jgi:hypothetical protein
LVSKAYVKFLGGSCSLAFRFETEDFANLVRNFPFDLDVLGFSQILLLVEKGIYLEEFQAVSFILEQESSIFSAKSSRLSKMRSTLTVLGSKLGIFGLICER